MINNRSTGIKYEHFAAEYLKAKGYDILEMNYRIRQAELDIVAKDDRCYVFVEVKYRADGKLGHPLSAVGVAKQKKICKAALFYLNSKKISIYDTAVRFDVIGILGDDVMHIKNAFDYVC